jgi:hypothetical protein
MSDSAAKLLADMQAYYDASDPWIEIEFADRFRDRVAALGGDELITHVFRTMADSKLTVWLRLLRFVWTGFSFSVWLGILARLSDDRNLIYQFLWFASGSLAWDIQRLPVSHPNVQRELRSSAFRSGADRPRSRALRTRLEDDFDYEAMWQRLQAEGAPLQDWRR